MRYRTALCFLLALSALAHAEAPISGKPNAGLRLLPPNSHTLDVGRVQPITVEIAAPDDEGELVVTATSNSADLTLLNPEARRHELTGEPVTLVFDVLPHADGRYYLMLLAELRRPDAAPQQQSLGVAIEAGVVRALKHHQKPESTDPGVISLPAEESIRPAEN